MEESKVISGRYTKVVEDISVRNTFLITLSIGVIGILVGIAIANTLISLVIPIVVMAVYIVITYFSKSDLPMTIIGDSYYYQGFIFTLTALMGSLFSLGINEKVDMNAMVASFGAALITTIIGLTARLFINSFSINSQQRREKLEVEIERALTTFSGQLEVLTTQVVSSINNVHANTQESLQKTISQYDKMNEKIVENQIRTSIEGHSKVEKAMGELAEKINAVSVSPDIISRPIQESLNEILSVLSEIDQKYTSHLSQFDKNANKLTIQMDNTANQIDVFVNGLSEKISSSIASSNKEISLEIESSSRKMLQSLDTIESLKSRTNNEVEIQLTSLAKSVSDTVQQLNEFGTPVKSVSEQVLRGVETISKGLTELETNIEKTSSSIVNLQGTNTNISELAENVKSLNKEIELGVSLNKQANDKVVAATNATEQGSLQLAKDIATVYKELSKQIERIREVP
ncbi:hypothetical protein [Glaciecola sp. HTCC2999]|uniref:hypothetical protein n=1 Tax=Glaciecola sp. HTCC2999 TaxID=455436 RepID=UPI0000E0E613|nr:hypothetical protein [Glaciecola sp. HTCC2999]